MGYIANLTKCGYSVTLVSVELGTRSVEVSTRFAYVKMEVDDSVIKVLEFKRTGDTSSTAS
jgi:hypothetical protein